MRDFTSALLWYCQTLKLEDDTSDELQALQREIASNRGSHPDLKCVYGSSTEMEDHC